MSEELPQARPRASGGRARRSVSVRVGIGVGVGVATDDWAAAARSLSGSTLQASIVRFESADSTEILRGLARSATGTSSLSTPSA